MQKWRFHLYIYIYIRMEGSSFHDTNGWSLKSWAFLEQLYAYFQALSLLSTSTCSNAIPFSCIYWVLWNSGGWVGLSHKEIFVQLSFLTWCFLIWVCPRSKSCNLNYQPIRNLTSLHLGKVVVLNIKSLHAQVQKNVQDKINNASSVCLISICFVFYVVL